MIKEQSEAGEPSPSDGLAPDFCPYKGLQPYTEADCPFFFGRDRDREIIIANLYASQLTVLYGASGVGKSSVLMAGVVPQIAQTARLAVVVFRNWQGDDLLAAMKRDLVRGINRSTGREQTFDQDLPFDDLLVQCANALRGSIFFIFDQFEEYFLYHPAENGSLFEAEFSRAVNREEVNANFLISMREDGLSKLDRFQRRIPNLLNNMLRLEHLDNAAATDAIRKPLEEYSRRAPSSNGPKGIETELVTDLLEELQTGKVVIDQSVRAQVSNRVRTAVSGNGIETPFLQLVLTRLWHEERSAGSRVLRRATLLRLGGPDSIARNHLDRQMENLSQAERNLTVRLFRYMVTPSGTKIAQEASSLASWTELKEDEVQSILNKLSSQEMRILRSVSAAGQPTRYEVFHDVLAGAILDWQRRRRLTRERDRVKRLRIGVLILLMVVFFLVLFGLRWSDKQQTIRANRVADSAHSVNADPELWIMLATAAVKIKRTPVTERELRAALSSPFRAVLRGHTKRVRSASYSPDGNFIVTSSDDGTAKIWDAATWLEVDDAVLPHPDTVYGAVYSPDGKFIATACRDRNARVWEVGAWKQTALLDGHTKAVRNVSFSPDGNLIATASEDDTSQVWRHGAKGWEKVADLLGHTDFVQTVNFSHNGKLIVTASRDNTVKIWEVGTWRKVQELTIPSVVRGAVFSPADDVIVTADEDNKTIIWKMVDGQWRADRTLLEHKDFVDAASFSRDGRFLATASRDNRAIVWDANAWLKVVTLIGHKREIYSASFSPDGKFIVTASDDWTAIVWKPQRDPADAAGSIDDLLREAGTRGTGELLAEDKRKYQLGM